MERALITELTVTLPGVDVPIICSYGLPRMDMWSAQLESQPCYFGSGATIEDAIAELLPNYKTPTTDGE